MKSVRLDPELEARLEEAARITGEPVSRIIRQAIEERCNTILNGRLEHRLADVIGSVNSGGGDSSRTGEVFKALLRERDERQR